MDNAQSEILNNDTTIVIRIYANLAEAQYAEAVLADNGIEAFVADSNAVQLYPMFASQGSGYRLHIFERDAERAAEILNAIEQNSDETND